MNICYLLILKLSNSFFRSKKKLTKNYENKWSQKLIFNKNNYSYFTITHEIININKTRNVLGLLD